MGPSCLKNPFCSLHFIYLFIYFEFYTVVFFFLILFNLTLQYCIGFAIYQHESATGIHVSPSWTLLPPPSPYHPSGSSHCTSPKHPVSCIEPGLATSFIYDIIHISMPFSQIIPPSPSPTESKRLFYKCEYLVLQCWVEGLEKDLASSGFFRQNRNNRKRNVGQGLLHFQ